MIADQNSIVSGLVPGCERIMCPPPSPPDHGDLVTRADHDHVTGDSVQWRCDPGHVMIGEPVTTCTHHGIWSHATPTCEYRQKS